MSAFESISTPAAPAPSVTVNVGRPRAKLAGGLLGTALLCGLSFYAGGSHERARFDAFVSEERTKADDERQRQAAALRDVQAASDLRAEQATAETTDLQTWIDSYVAQLSRRPVSDRWTLTDADLHGLRDLAPGGAPARAHRRPARASRDEDLVRCSRGRSAAARGRRRPSRQRQGARRPRNRQPAPFRRPCVLRLRLQGVQLNPLRRPIGVRA